MAFFILNHLLWLFFLVSSNLCQNVELEPSSLIPDGYDSSMQPGSPLYTDTLNVSISIYVTSLVTSSDAAQTITLDLILIQQWTDSRLNVSSLEGNQTVTLTKAPQIGAFWRPELYFVNGLSVTVVKAFQEIQKLTINSAGELTYVQRLNAHLNCPMNLQNWPHDVQLCRVQVSTLVYEKEYLNLIWKVFEASPGEYAIFKIRHTWTAVCEGWETPLPENSCLIGTLKLVRRLEYYIIRYYLVTFLSAAICCVQFWVPVNAWPARVTLICNPLLQLITQDISINNDIGVYYVTSFHWWMMWLQGLIFLQFVEYALALSWVSFINDKKHFAAILESANNNTSGAIATPVPVPAYVYGYYFGNNGCYSKCGEFFESFLHFFFGPIDYQRDPNARNKIDYVFRVIFTFFFILFVFLYIMITVIYWSANYN